MSLNFDKLEGHCFISFRLFIRWSESLFYPGFSKADWLKPGKKRFRPCAIQTKTDKTVTLPYIIWASHWALSCGEDLTDCQQTWVSSDRKDSVAWLTEPLRWVQPR